MADLTRAVILRCKAANAAQLSACYREEAQAFARAACEAAPDDEWSLSDPGGDSANSDGLPDNWIELASFPDKVSGRGKVHRVNIGGRFYVTTDRGETWTDPATIPPGESQE